MAPSDKALLAEALGRAGRLGVPVDFPMVWSPPPAPPPRPQRRKSGDPHCGDCRRGHPCEAHQDFAIDPLRTLG